MRVLIAVIVAVVVILAAIAGFAAGFAVRSVVGSFDQGQTSGPEQASADQVGELATEIIEALDDQYYKKIDIQTLEQSGIDGLLKPLHDPWTVYMDPKETKDFQDANNGSYAGIGAALIKKGKKLMVTHVFADSPARDAGMGAGDRVLTVDGVRTASRSVQVNVDHIRGPAGSKVTLELIRRGSSDVETLTLTRRQISIPETKTKLIERDGMKIGYIRLFEFARGVGKTVHDEADSLRSRGAEAIILDLRGNGGGLISESVDVTSDFISKGVVVTTEGLHSPKEVLSARSGMATTLPAAVLVDGNTASASEITAGALKDHHRATIIGTRTYGKGLVQTVVEMPGGASFKLTVAVYYTPDGRDINHLGIKPDIVARDLLETPRDEALDRAVTFLATGR